MATPSYAYHYRTPDMSAPRVIYAPTIREARKGAREQYFGPSAQGEKLPRGTVVERVRP
jgi:hypothetical protein